MKEKHDGIRHENTPAASEVKAIGIYRVVLAFPAVPTAHFPKSRRAIEMSVFATSEADALEKGCKYYRRFAMAANKHSALKKYWAPLCARVSGPESFGEATVVRRVDLTRRQFGVEYEWNQLEQWHHMIVDPDYFPTPYEEDAT